MGVAGILVLQGLDGGRGGYDWISPQVRHGAVGPLSLEEALEERRARHDGALPTRSHPCLKAGPHVETEHRLERHAAPIEVPSYVLGPRPSLLGGLEAELDRPGTKLSRPFEIF